MVLTFIFLYLLANVVIGYWAARRVKNVTDFALASRRLPIAMAASAMFATWFGSETVLGASAEFAENGILGVIEDPFGASLCLVLVGAFFARKLYRMNLLTLSDYYRNRFNRTAEFFSAIFLIPSYFGWIAAQLVALGIILQAIAGIEIGYGIVICTVVVMFYTYFGGMWAVAITDFIQTIVIIIGMIALTVMLLVSAGGWAKVAAAQPEGFFNFLPQSGWEPGLEYFAAWVTIGLGSIPAQDVFQRVMSAKSERVAVQAAYLSAGMYLVVALLPLIIVIAGLTLYPDLQVSLGQMLLPAIVTVHGSEFMQILFFGALLSAVLSSASGAIIAPSTILAVNLVKPFRPGMSQRQLLKWMRISVIFISIVSAAMALMKKDIFELVAQSSILSLVSLFVPLTAGLYWKKANSYGAIASMCAGIAVWGAAEIWEFAGPSLVWGLGASVAGLLVGNQVKNRYIRYN